MAVKNKIHTVSINQENLEKLKKKYPFLKLSTWINEKIYQEIKGK